jgi:flagellar basal-body rod modification protein FlgD
MSVTGVTPVRSAAANASAATGNAAASSSSKAFDDILQQLRAGAPSAGAPDGAASGAPKASDDPTEDRFLKLLVAQMRNQDPLNPLDNAQVTSQLAQINTVKGIDRLNVALQKLVDRGESGTATEAAAMVGRRVLVEGNTLELPDEGPAQAGFELAAAASSVRVEVVGRNGAVVDTRTLTNVPAGLHTFEWDGDAGADRAAAGTYSLRVTATDGTEAVPATPLAAAPVRAVTRGADGVALQLGTFGSRPLDQVRGIL